MGIVLLSSSPHSYWQDLVPSRLLTEGPQVLSMHISSYGSFLLWTYQMEHEKSVNKMEIMIFYNVISEVTSHYFHHILLVKSKS